jgi:hypothetical protein
METPSTSSGGRIQNASTICESHTKLVAARIPEATNSRWTGRRGRELVFVEVKTRRTDRFGTPAEAVTPAKQRRLRALAGRYVAATGARGAVRFDVVSILAGDLQVISAAF